MRILGSLLLEYRSILLNKVSNEIIVNFSKEMINHLMKIEYFIFKTNSEQVLNSFNKSLMGIERLNRFVVGNVMSNLIEISIILGMIFGMLGPKYFINTVCIYGIYMYVTKKVSKFRGQLLNEKYQFEIKSENKLFDIIYNIDNIKYFQQENAESRKFSDIIKDVRSKDVKVVYSLALLNNFQNLIISTGMVLNLVMGVLDCFSGALTPGDIVMMQAIFLQIMMPLNFMGMLMREVDETKVNLQYAVQMIKKKESYLKENKSKESCLFYFNGGKIELKNVSFEFPNMLIEAQAPPSNKDFAYFGKSGSQEGKEKGKDFEVKDFNNKLKKDALILNSSDKEVTSRNSLLGFIAEPGLHDKYRQNLNSNKLILNNCNAVFEKNTVNAIIGHSGNGKSTIFNLLYKLYEPNSGKILVDNQEISGLDSCSYRKVINH